MISKVLNGKEYLFVEVPEEAHQFRVQQSKYGRHRLCYMPRKILSPIQEVRLLEGDYTEIIGKASELTEAQWKVIVESDRSSRFNSYKGDHLMWYYTASASGFSLISSLNLKPQTTLIILKQ